MPETEEDGVQASPPPTGGMNERIADMVWRFYEGDDAENGVPLTWLRCLGCGVRNNGDGSYTIRGTSGMTCGLTRSDPITVFVQFAFALAGMFWPQVFGGAQKIINKRWSAETEQKKADGVPSPETPPPETLLPDTPPGASAPAGLRRWMAVAEPLYSIGTWDTELQAYTPQEGLTVPCVNVPLRTLLEVLRQLKRMGYSCHRFRDANGEHDDNDWAVLVERTDGAPAAEVLRAWER